MKISVLTPSYQSGAYLERAIQSVLIQEYPAFEHVVCDGGSTDQTMVILKNYPHLDWTSERDRGQADAMNKAFLRSKGDIVVYLNADDYFSPGVFQAVAAFFESNPDIDLVAGKLEIIRVDAQTMIEPAIGYEEVLQFWKHHFPYNPVSYFYRRCVQESAGPLNVNNHTTMDYEFLLKALQKHRASKLDMIFGVFHLHGQNKTLKADTDRLCFATALRHCLIHDRRHLGLILGGYTRYRLGLLRHALRAATLQ